MELASFSNFLRTVLWIVFFYYAFRFVARLLFPVLVKKAVSHAEEQFRQQQQSYQHYQNADTYRNTKKDGEVTVDTTGARPSMEKKKVGEYVDFEELN